ncbi:MAG: NifU family protein [Acidobacteriota bacterium]|nr:MAG: NifU family protein [Acidobacteriota bacterium]
MVVDPASARNLNGVTVDYEDRVVRSGFKFDNPNKPEVPQVGSGPRGDLTGSVAEKVEHLLETELNPAVAAHGGRITLAGVKDNKVYLTFGGGCHGCGMVDVTLKQGVEARIRELIPEITEVIDTTDHSSGERPFYA